MKKLLFMASIASFLALNSVKAQTQLFFDNFESYTAELGLVSQSGLPWATWSGGLSDDATVTGAFAYNGNNSVRVNTDKDIILNLGDKTTGRYQVSFHKRVAAGSMGYFNLLNEFAGANSIWAIQVYFNSDGTGSVDANGANAATFNYTLDQWMYINIIVDVDDDYATLYIDGNEIISWIFSKGASGDEDLPKLDALNLYGHSEGVVPGLYYIDDVSFNEMVSFSPPTDLVATLTGDDIELTWNAPGLTPDSYRIIANNNIIASGITVTNYTHANPYPNTYSYTVRAHYDSLGYSPSSNIAVETRPGGSERNFVVLERATGTWCNACPGAAMAVSQMEGENLKVANIAYHYDDNYETPQSLIRLDYYGIVSFPTVIFDGTYQKSGGSQTENQYPVYKPIFDEKIEIPSIYELDMEIEQISQNSYKATVNVIENLAYFSGTLKMYGVLTESNILVNWHGQTKVDFVCREIFPGTDGINLDFSTNDSLTIDIDFDIETTWVKNNCQFIVFIQVNETKEILQAAKIKMSTIVDIEEYNIESSLIIRPNPASEFISVYAKDINTISILNLTGQTVLEKNVSGSESHINIEHLTKGIYLVRVIGSDGIATRKLVVM